MELSPIISSTVASNSRVPAPDMVEELQEAFDAPDTEAIYSVIRKVYLVGQDRNYVLHKVFESACRRHDTSTLNRILDLDYESVPAVQPIRVNSLWPEAVRLSLVDNCACVLRCFLRNGLDPHQKYDDEGDVLMWAVRGRCSDTVMYLLRMGCDAEGVKLYGKHSNMDIVAGLIWEEDREAYRFEFIEILRTCQHLVELGGTRDFSQTGLLQAVAGNGLCEPLAIRLAKLLIERGADVNELPPEDLRYYKMDDEDYSAFEVGTALEKATAADHQEMVNLLLNKGAIRSPSSSN